jgi:hypothetical protein
MRGWRLPAWIDYRRPISANVSWVHEAPEPSAARRRGFHAAESSTTFTARVASARQRALHEPGVRRSWFPHGNAIPDDGIQ